MKVKVTRKSPMTAPQQPVLAWAIRAPEQPLFAFSIACLVCSYIAAYIGEVRWRMFGANEYFWLASCLYYLSMILALAAGTILAARLGGFVPVREREVQR